MERGSLINKLL